MGFVADSLNIDPLFHLSEIYMVAGWLYLLYLPKLLCVQISLDKPAIYAVVLRR